MDSTTGMTMDTHATMTMGTGTTATGAAAASQTSMSMGGHGGGMSMGGSGCKISMLWNWNTIDACFISSTWRIKSSGMFAGSCIGVILLVMSLEFLRRAVKEYDRYLIRTHAAKNNNAGFQPLGAGSSSSNNSKNNIGAATSNTKPTAAAAAAAAAACAPCVTPPFRPNLLQQAVRAGLHMVQFAVAYFVMLLAMYYNGYFIICIFIGAYLGAFVFQWEVLGEGGQGTSAAKEATVCCG